MIRGRRFLQCALLLLASAANAFPTGKAAFDFDAGNGLKINVLVYQSAKFDRNSPIQFAMRVPENRAEWAIAANANKCIWPEGRAEKGAFPLPNGLLGVDRAESKLKQVLGKTLIILLGEMDNDPKHHQVTHGTQVDQQGLERLSRGRNFFNAGQTAAVEQKVDLRWSLKTVTNTGHVNAAMTRAAIEMMYPVRHRS